MRIFFDASLVGVGTDTYACNIEGQTVTLDDGTSYDTRIYCVLIIKLDIAVRRLIL